MPETARHGRMFAAALAAMLLALPVAAHETKGVGPLRLTIGWGEEPALSGTRNSIDVDVSDKAGKPVADPAAVLSVDVTFGEERITLPLRPVAGRPGGFRAWLVPTRPGTYTFRITGKMKAQAIDVSSTCSDETFDCVTDASDLHFPAKDPSTGQLADRVNRALPRADRAVEAATQARTLGGAALAVAVLALAVAFGMSVRNRPKGA